MMVVAQPLRTSIGVVIFAFANTTNTLSNSSSKDGSFDTLLLDLDGGGGSGGGCRGRRFGGRGGGFGGK
jgi:hypothetical protein